MFKITSHMYQIRSLLLRSRPCGLPVASYSRTSPYLQYKKPSEPERETCPEPPKVCPPQKNDRLFWGTVAALAVVGGFAFCAKDNPEVRDWLTINAPWFDDFIAVLFQENMSYMETAVQIGGKIKKSVTNLLDTRECTIDEDGNPVYTVREVGDKPDPCHTDDEKHPKEAEEEVEEQEEDDDEEESPCVHLPPPILTKDVCELEACLKELGDNTVHNYMTARDACIYYNKFVQDTMLNFKYQDLKKIRKEMLDRQDLVKRSVEDAESTHVQLKDINRYIECGGLKSPPEQTKMTKDLLQEYLTNTEILKTELAWENATSQALDVQWIMVECLLDKYANENSSYYGNLNYLDDYPQLGTPDVDFLLIHSQKYMQYLQALLNEQSCVTSERVERAVGNLPQDEKSVKDRNNKISTLYKQKKADLDKEYSQRITDLKANSEKNLKQALRDQSARHEKNMVIKLEEREKSASEKLKKLVDAKVAEEEKIMARQLEEMRIKLSIVESKLNSRLKAEAETRRSHELYAAGMSLLAATRKGEPSVKVDRELRAIEKASGDGDKLVLSVLHSIPNEVWDRGVVPESVLKERYKSMEKVAMKVALVEEEGAPLPVYVLSWLQALLLCMRMSTIPQAEIDNPPKEPCKKLDTFDLLQRARFWLERGNLAMALRYVGALQGASRVAAGTWHDDARIHVEIRQAAEALMAHAAALGLQYV